jgi:hypothetical protein
MPQQCLNFLPLPQGHGSFLPVFTRARRDGTQDASLYYSVGAGAPAANMQRQSIKLRTSVNVQVSYPGHRSALP